MNGAANIIHSSAWVSGKSGSGAGIPGFKTRLPLLFTKPPWINLFFVSSPCRFKIHSPALNRYIGASTYIVHRASRPFLSI